MIKINELRVGNTVSLNSRDYKNIQTKITGISDMVFSCKEGVFVPEKFEAIPIVSEYLLKLGFERLFETGSTYSLGDFNVSDFGENGIFHYDVKQPIKYVHQLQNLYFALTGEELVFSLD